MRLDFIKNKQVYDSKGEKVGQVIDVDFKEDGSYTLIVSGELDDVQRAKAIEKFGAVGETDTFELPLSLIQGMSDEIVLNKELSDVRKEVRKIRSV